MELIPAACKLRGMMISFDPFSTPAHCSPFYAKRETNKLRKKNPICFEKSVFTLTFQTLNQINKTVINIKKNLQSSWSSLAFITSHSFWSLQVKGSRKTNNSITLIHKVKSYLLWKTLTTTRWGPETFICCVFRGFSLRWQHLLRQATTGREKKLWYPSYNHFRKLN